jgi:hypothetical protein
LLPFGEDFGFSAACSGWVTGFIPNKDEIPPEAGAAFTFGFLRLLTPLRPIKYYPPTLKNLEFSIWMVDHLAVQQWVTLPEAAGG